MKVESGTLSTSYYLIFCFLIAFVLMPRPPVEWAQYLTVGGLGFFALAIILSVAKKNRFSYSTLHIFSIFYLFILSISLSIIFNLNILSINSLIHVLKPIFFMLVLSAGLFVATNKSEKVIEKGLLKFAYVTILIEAAIGITQLFGLSITDWIYSEEKARGFGEIVRITGTLTNPNIFAWIILQTSVLIFLFEKNKVKKLFFLILGFSLVILAGSRSLIFVFPAALILIEVLKQKKTASFFLVKIPLLTITFVFLLFLLSLIVNSFGDYLPYVSELTKVFASGDITELKSYNDRVYIWSQLLIDFDGTLISWLFGLGAGYIGVADNDYLYSFLNYGLMGISLNLLIYFIIYIYFSKLENRKISVLGRQYIILSLIIGTQVETLSGWNYPVLIMFYTGICMALLKNKDNERFRCKTRIALKH